MSFNVLCDEMGSVHKASVVSPGIMSILRKAQLFELQAELATFLLGHHLYLEEG